MNAPREFPLWLSGSAPRPLCFDAADWERWRQACTLRSPAIPPPSSPCEDCLPQHQAAMLAANRCRHPEVTFQRDEDGFVRGRLPPSCRAVCAHLGVCQSLHDCWNKPKARSLT